MFMKGKSECQLANVQRGDENKVQKPEVVVHFKMLLMVFIMRIEETIAF